MDYQLNDIVNDVVKKQATFFIQKKLKLQYEPIDLIVEMKKQHPCKKSNQWKIIRMGADIKIKCLGCNAIVMFSRRDFEKRLKKVVEHVE